jgi:hypothetical protein
MAAMPSNPGIDVMGQKLTAVPGHHVAFPKTRTTGGTVGTAKAPGQFLSDRGGLISDTGRLISIEGAET